MMDVSGLLNPWQDGADLLFRILFCLNILGATTCIILAIRHVRTDCGISVAARWVGRLFLGAHVSLALIGLGFVEFAVHQDRGASLPYAVLVTLIPGLVGGSGWLFLLLRPPRDRPSLSILPQEHCRGQPSVQEVPNPSLQRTRYVSRPAGSLLRSPLNSNR